MLQDHTLRSLFNSAWSLVPPVGYSAAQAPPAMFSQGPNVTTVTITSTGKTTVTVNIDPDGTATTSTASTTAVPASAPAPGPASVGAEADPSVSGREEELTPDPTPAPAHELKPAKTSEPTRSSTGYVAITSKDWCTHLSYYEVDGSLDTARADRHRQLAYLGDGLLECATRRILFDLYPETTNRTAFDLRNSLVSEVALAPLSVRIGLHLQLRSSDPGMRNLSRMQSELFEAYVAAFEQEYGYSAVYAWLFDVYEPIIHRLVKALKVRPIKALPVKDGVVSHKPATGQQSYVNLRAYANSTGRMLVTKFDDKGTGTKAKHNCTLVCGKYATLGHGHSRKAASEVAVAKMWDALASERKLTVPAAAVKQPVRATSASVHAPSDDSRDSHDEDSEEDDDDSDGYSDESD